MITTADLSNWFTRSWDPLTDPTLPLREPSPGPWLVESDLFGLENLTPGGVLDDFVINRAHATIALSPGATFLVMTEWPRPMTTWLRKQSEKPLWGSLNHLFWYAELATGQCSVSQESHKAWRWPLPNLIPAVRLASQSDADRLIPELLRVPCGPMGRAVVMRPREPIDLTQIGHGDQRGLNALSGEFKYYMEDDGEPCSDWGPSLGWAVIPPDAEFSYWWAKELLAQCRAAGVPLWSGPEIDGERVREFPEGVQIHG